MNPFTALSLISGATQIVSKVMPIADFVGDQWKKLAKREDVPEELTEAQAEAVESDDVSKDLRELITNVLPVSIVNHVNDGSKNTVETCKIVKKVLLEVIEWIDVIIDAAQKVDDNIQD